MIYLGPDEYDEWHEDTKNIEDYFEFEIYFSREESEVSKYCSEEIKDTGVGPKIIYHTCNFSQQPVHEFKPPDLDVTRIVVSNLDERKVFFRDFLLNYDPPYGSYYPNNYLDREGAAETHKNAMGVIALSVRFFETDNLSL